MYYNELRFQDELVRFVHDKVVYKDIYQFFPNCIYKYVPPNELETIEAVDIFNSLDCIKDSDELILEVVSVKGLEEIFEYLRNNGFAVDGFKHWLFNFAIQYVREISNLNIEISLLKSDNYSLTNAVNNLQQKDTDNTKSIVDLKFTVTEIKDILLGLVGLDDKDLVEEESSFVQELQIAYAMLQVRFNTTTDRRINSEYCKVHKIKLLQRAKNRNLNLIDYILSDKVITRNTLDLINKVLIT